jgi:hypothetical protein
LSSVLCFFFIGQCTSAAQAAVALFSAVLVLYTVFGSGAACAGCFPPRGAGAIVMVRVLLEHAPYTLFSSAGCSAPLLWCGSQKNPHHILCFPPRGAVRHCYRVPASRHRSVVLLLPPPRSSPPVSPRGGQVRCKPALCRKKRHGYKTVLFSASISASTPGAPLLPGVHALLRRRRTGKGDQ